MSSASTVSSSLRESANEAREGVREIGKAASGASADIQKDLQALRDDIARLAEQIADIIADKGHAAWGHARSGADEAVSDAEQKGLEAIDAMRQITDEFVETIEGSLKSRPYVTLAIAAGLGFLFGASWRR